MDVAWQCILERLWKCLVGRYGGCFGERYNEAYDDRAYHAKGLDAPRRSVWGLVILAHPRHMVRECTLIFDPSRD